MMIHVLRWLAVLVLAFTVGKLITKIKMPSILGWLIVGMLFGPHALRLLPQDVLTAGWYQTIVMWMQCGFGVMLGTELIWKKLKHSGKALIVTTLTQSLGTFAVVSLAFGIVFALANVPVFLAFVFGGIALATAPAPAVSVVNEFHAEGPVTDTLLPMTILDDVVGIAVFFAVNSLIARAVSGGAVPMYMIPVMIFLPVLIGAAVGLPTGLLLKKAKGKAQNLTLLLGGITVTVIIGWLLNTYLLSGIALNYTLMGLPFLLYFPTWSRRNRWRKSTVIFYRSWASLCSP